MRRRDQSLQIHQRESLRSNRERHIAERRIRDEEIMDREIREATAAYFAEVEREAALNEEVSHLERRLQRDHEAQNSNN